MEQNNQIDENPSAAKLAALLQIFLGAETPEELEEAKRLGPLIVKMSPDEVTALTRQQTDGQPLRHARDAHDSLLRALRGG